MLPSPGPLQLIMLFPSLPLPDVWCVLATLCVAQVGKKLVALNLSQQTDSADLLGGFQPVDPSHALLPLLEHFQVRQLPAPLQGKSMLPQEIVLYSRVLPWVCER